MRVIPRHALSRLRNRLAAEGGFTMMIALGVMTVTSLLVAGTYAAVQGDTRLTQRDLDAKRAYYAARAGVNRFLYQLNQNPNEWQTCPTKSTPTPIAPGSEQKYTFRPVPANGSANCTTSDPITTFIDADSGTFRMQFTGYAGSPEVKRGLIASFRKDTPLDYLWFTVYETLDPSTYSNPTWADANCKKFFREGRPPGCVNIVWVSNDDVNGPAYTQDQYMIHSGAAPVFGRPNTTDQIESSAPGINPQDVCTNSNCQNAVFNGTRVPNAPVIAPPPDNEELRTDAQTYGVEYTGMTRIVLSTANGGQATITRCPASGCLAPFNIPIGRYPSREPIIYVNDGTGCTYSYSPYNVTYSSSFVSGGTGPATSNCGNVYVSGTYNQSVTIAADRDIIIQGNITRSGNTAVLGLVANNFVRVMHGVSGRPVPADRDQCGSPGTNISGQTLSNPTIHAAILAIKHSFIVDNYDCGAALGELNVIGAIAQYFRGTVGKTSGQGYFKDYNYDDRLAVAQPPYLFNVASSSWHIERETLCVPGGTAPSTRCLEPGT